MEPSAVAVGFLLAGVAGAAALVSRKFGGPGWGAENARNVAVAKLPSLPPLPDELPPLPALPPPAPAEAAVNRAPFSMESPLAGVSGPEVGLPSGRREATYRKAPAAPWQVSEEEVEDFLTAPW